MELTRWKLIAGGAALAGITAGGIIGAAADDGIDLNDRRTTITLAADDGANDSPDRIVDDGSPESADSPNESVEDSADSPFDSPDDPGFDDGSPESADSPNSSAQDSPASAPAPAPTSADSSDSPAPAPVSADSPDSGDSDD